MQKRLQIKFLRNAVEVTCKQKNTWKVKIKFNSIQNGQGDHMYAAEGLTQYRKGWSSPACGGKDKG